MQRNYCTHNSSTIQLIRAFMLTRDQNNCQSRPAGLVATFHLFGGEQGFESPHLHKGA